MDVCLELVSALHYGPSPEVVASSDWQHQTEMQTPIDPNRRVFREDVVLLCLTCFEPIRSEFADLFVKLGVVTTTVFIGVFV